MEFDQYPNLSEGADRVGGQLRGDKECPFSGVTKSGRVWRKVPESDARSVVSALRKVWVLIKLQALVYDILPSTTTVFSYATGSRKLSANEQFFVGAQTVVSLLQTTPITSNVCFVTDQGAYASSNKTKIV